MATRRTAGVGHLFDPAAARASSSTDLRAVSDGDRRAARQKAASRAQEVRDDQGRRRFHGAFTGGWSAGYFNTVGTAEGWAPTAFTSSRTQSVYDYMDEEDDALAGAHLRATAGFSSEGGSKSSPSAPVAPEMDVMLRAMGGLTVPDAQPVGERILAQLGGRMHRPVAHPATWSSTVAAAAPVAQEEDDFADVRTLWATSALVSRRAFGVGYDAGSVDASGGADDPTRLKPTAAGKRLHMAASVNPDAYTSVSHRLALEDDDDDALAFRNVAFDARMDETADASVGKRGRWAPEASQPRLMDAPAAAAATTAAAALPGFTTSTAVTRVFTDLASVYPTPVVPASFTGRRIHVEPPLVGTPEAQPSSAAASAASVRPTVTASPAAAAPPPMKLKKFVVATVDDGAVMAETVQKLAAAASDGPSTSSGGVQPTRVMRSNRTWMPAPLLLRRWNVADPFTDAERRAAAPAVVTDVAEGAHTRRP